MSVHHSCERADQNLHKLTSAQTRTPHFGPRHACNSNNISKKMNNTRRQGFKKSQKWRELNLGSFMVLKGYGSVEDSLALIS
jgi:hypothetical protein